MFVPFEKLPPSARVWVYQSSETMTQADAQLTQSYLSERLVEWTAHGAALQASVQVRHGRLVLLGLNEAQQAASGCSIDASTRWFKELGERLGIDFFDRSLLYWQGQNLQSISLAGIKNAASQGHISAKTLIIDTNIQQISDLDTWQKPADQAWTKRFFKAPTGLS
jgi:hypothetical protein